MVFPVKSWACRVHKLLECARNESQSLPTQISPLEQSYTIDERFARGKSLHTCRSDGRRVCPGYRKSLHVWRIRQRFYACGFNPPRTSRNPDTDSKGRSAAALQLEFADQLSDLVF